MNYKTEPVLYRFPGGTKTQIIITTVVTNTQITVGGRNTGTVKFSIRPLLPDELGVITEDTPTYTDTDNFQKLPDHDVNLVTVGGVRTHAIETTFISAIEVDDTGNTGPFWVTVWQYTQGH